MPAWSNGTVQGQETGPALSNLTFQVLLPSLDWTINASRAWAVVEHTSEALAARGCELALDLARRAWQLALYVEKDLPDVLVWILILTSAISLVRLFFRRLGPRVCLAAALTWMTWLGLQVWQDGASAWQSMLERGQLALKATQRFAQDGLVMVQAWLYFFLPFLKDLCRHLALLWGSLSPRSRRVLIGSGFAGYVLLVAVSRLVTAFRKRQRAMRRALGIVVFHSSFLLLGPVIWQLAGMLPEPWLPGVLEQLLTTVPTFCSLLALGWRPLAKPMVSVHTKNGEEADAAGNTPLRGARFSRLTSMFSRRGADVLANARADASKNTPSQTLEGSSEAQRLWLAYWATWPLLVALEPLLLLALRLPALELEVETVQVDLRRGLVVFVLWLQLWHGSRLMQGMLRWLFANSPLTDVLLCLGGEPLAWLKALLRGGLKNTPGGMMNSLWLIQVIWRRRWLLWISAALATFLFLLAAYLFHRTLRFLNDLTTVALWLLAAVDSAEALTQREPAYERKLAFWILARLWTAATCLPMVGEILRLFTAPAFAVFLAAPGEILLRRVMIPLLTLASTPVRVAVSWLTAHCGFGALARLTLRVRRLADFAGSVAARHAAAAVDTETDTMPDEAAEGTAVAKDEVPGSEEGAGLADQRLTEPVAETTGLEDSAADGQVPAASQTPAADDGLEDVGKSLSACSQPSVAAGEIGQQPSPGMSPAPSSSTIAESDQQASEKAGAPSANGLRSRTGRQKKTKAAK